VKLKIALEWFLNPDHLPFIAGIQMGKYKQAGLEVELIEPKEHYDGFEALKNGEIDIHINEPIHLFEHYFEDLKSLGCFFETQGGVMIKYSSVEKMRNNEPLRITTPASNPLSNRVGFEILKRYALKEQFVLDEQNVEFVETDFYHLKNLQEGNFDGAWLCFYNFEVVEANHIGFEHLFIDQTKSPYANFSALELMSTKSVLKEKQEAITKFIAITNEMIRYLAKNDELAKTVYYDYSKMPKDKLMDKIIDDTLTRFNYLKNDSLKWKNLYDFLHELKLLSLTTQEYDNIWTL